MIEENVFLFVPPRSLGRARVTSSSGAFATAAARESIWELQTRLVFGLEGVQNCRAPAGQDAGGNWARAFVLWYAAAREVGLNVDIDGESEVAAYKSVGPALARWIELWRRLRRCLGDTAPDILRTLKPPVRTNAVEKIAEIAGVYEAQVAPAVVGLWAVSCDGQLAPQSSRLAQVFVHEDSSVEASWANGLLGGYAAYDHTVSTLLLPLDSAATFTGFIRNRCDELRQHPTKIVLACSHSLLKPFFVDVVDGSVHVRTNSATLERVVPVSDSVPVFGDAVVLRDLQARPELNGHRGTLAAFVASRGRWQVKMDDGSGTHLLKIENLELIRDPASRAWPAMKGDGLLRWLEEYARRLERGTYTVLPLQPTDDSPTNGIVLFPEAGAEVASCITRGVEVVASCIYMPEHNAGWTYSIRFRLVGTAEERGFESCQLQTREWIIQEDGHQPEIVRGEGVIGFFPILVDGGWLLNRESDPHRQYSTGSGHIDGFFRYQSCSGRNASMSGSFGGYVDFVPGTARRPTGPLFRVRVEPFTLRVPEFIY
eukprot:TRINITY_DN9682_c0_g1_i2.p1 TRINITY_DN9682_c0_g1~~TRINITY_DN9682_c0_g1_i2.p1  ORF type:complete len:567 (-),score=80.21 TRINITY_DN9682_c0_g1_i2:45-1670(-)